MYYFSLTNLLDTIVLVVVVVIVGDLVVHHSSARCKNTKNKKTGEVGRYKYKGKRGKNTWN